MSSLGGSLSSASTALEESAWKLFSIDRQLPKDALIAVVIAHGLIEHAEPDEWVPMVAYL